MNNFKSFLNRKDFFMRMYFIAVVLPKKLNEKILRFKQFMKEHYGCKVALRSPAHITLIPPFWMEEEKEEKLRAEVETVSGKIGSFVINHPGFSSFPKKTIFVDVLLNDELKDLHFQVVQHFQKFPEFKMKFDDRPFRPHVTIATRDLTKAAYTEAWDLFSEKKFTEEWNCSSISLLRLAEGGWEVIADSNFRK